MILTYSANAFVFLSKHERLLLKIFCEYHIYCCLFRTTISQKTAHKNRLNVEEIELGMNYRLTLTVVELWKYGKLLIKRTDINQMLSKLVVILVFITQDDSCNAICNIQRIQNIGKSTEIIDEPYCQMNISKIWIRNAENFLSDNSNWYCLTYEFIHWKRKFEFISYLNRIHFIRNYSSTSFFPHWKNFWINFSRPLNPTHKLTNSCKLQLN